VSLDLVIVGKTDAARWLNSPTRKLLIRGVVSIGAVEGHLCSPKRGNPHGFTDIRCTKIRLEYDDIETEVEYNKRGIKTHVGPMPHHLESLLSFAGRIDLEKDGTLLIHCYVGKSRSTAAAYIIYASKWGPDRAMEAAKHIYERQALFQKYGLPTPNVRMVTLASEIIGWDMLTPLQAYQDTL